MEGLLLEVVEEPFWKSLFSQRWLQLEDDSAMEWATPRAFLRTWVLVEEEVGLVVFVCMLARGCRMTLNATRV
jgi:hypothetical protein